MKRHQRFLTAILGIFGLSVICGCATLFSPKTKYPEVPEDYPFSVIWKQPKEETVPHGSWGGVFSVVCWGTSLENLTFQIRFFSA